MTGSPDATPAAPRRPYGGVSHEERTERRRQQFLDAGLELFGTVGYQHTTVRALAKQAGATDRYFYESFANKEALLTAVYHACMDRVERAIVDALADLPDEAPAEAVVRTALDAYLGEFEDRRLARVSWTEVTGVSPAVDDAYRSGVRRFAHLFTQIVRTRLPELMPPEPVVGVVSIALMGAVSETSLQWYLAGYDLPRATIVDGLTYVITSAAAPTGDGASGPT